MVELSHRRRCPLTERLAWLALAGICAGCSRVGPELDEAVLAAAASMDSEPVREVIAELSADRYAGREPGTPGDAAARAYIADRLAAIGFEPGAGPNAYEQPFELVGVRATQPPRWRFTASGGSVDLVQSQDFIVASGLQSSIAEIRDAEVVFVGYGIQAPEYDWDDFEGVDVSGKVLVFLNNDPDWDDDLFEGIRRLYYGRWSYKYESAARQGAAGAIIIHTTPSAGYPWQVVQTSWTGTQFELPDRGEARIPIEAWITEDAARRLFTTAGQDLDALVSRARSRDFTPVPLELTTSLRLTNELSTVPTANVLGVLPGSDAEISDEYVIYTAHHDHLGTGEPVDGDGVYNGARDNASGVAMVLEIGAAFAALPEPPRRSIMLLFVGAEEQGLLGSEYFAASPTVPPGKMAANINFDSGNIWGRTRDITFIGLGKSTLDAVGRVVADHENRVLEPDEFPDRGMYYRSDQFSFAKIGVPAFYFSSGIDFVGRPEGWGVEQINRYTDERYHQPSDELTADWSFEGMLDDARFGFLAGWLIAGADDMPRWYPGDEFEAARDAALAELQ
jgi:Zn-dependent M28 family amino/carboxypeptidase